MKAPAVLASLVVGAIIGGMAVEYWLTRTTPRPGAQTAAPAGDLAADVAHLKSIQLTQSTSMMEVGYHWASLWFAAGNKNWPLARYLFDEARQGVRWTILIKPVRDLPGGGTVNIKGLFAAIDPSAFAAVQIAIEDEDHAQFVATYKQTLEACHSCHVAIGKPFLRPVIPTVPPSTMIGFEPAPK